MIHIKWICTGNAEASKRLSSHGAGSSQRAIKIPLNPPFSKGEISFPPLEKGGEGGFERLFSSETGKEKEVMPQFSKGKSQKNGKVTVYVCKDFTCSEPLTESGEIERQL